MNNPFEHYGIMIDNSRNAVMKPEMVKSMIDILEKLDFNTLMLYTEDTFEVNNQPYFGYLRGRYSKEELKEMDEYAKRHHVELMPCVQTLAHLTALVRWPQYRNICDCNDILCAGEEEVYELIEDIFATLDECFTSRIVNIGMDEAEMVGLGKYLKKNGYRNRVEILGEHLNRVADIAKKYGFTLCMWSDMFFKLAAGSYYDTEDIDVTIADMIPDNVKLIYWDYYSTDKDRYDNMIQKHLKLQEHIWFAGGLWTWPGFAPHNTYAQKVSEAAVKSCLEHGVKDVIFTVWGDNGGECSRFSVLPSLFYNSCLGKGITDEVEIKRQFEEVFEIPFDAFMLLDLPGTPNDTEGTPTADKYMLYNDCFLGIMDLNVCPQDAKGYAECAEKLVKWIEHPKWGWLFETMMRLCEVNAVKCEIGLRTRRAYQEGDKKTLRGLLDDYDVILEKIEAFYEAFERQWMIENKPHGFDVQDIRIGGLIQRVKHCKKRLKAYVNEEITAIPELEEKILSVTGEGADVEPQPILYNFYVRISTVNLL